MKLAKREKQAPMPPPDKAMKEGVCFDCGQKIDDPEEEAIVFVHGYLGEDRLRTSMRHGSPAMCRRAAGKTKGRKDGAVAYVLVELLKRVEDLEKRYLALPKPKPKPERKRRTKRRKR